MRAVPGTGLSRLNLETESVIIMRPSSLTSAPVGLSQLCLYLALLQIQLHSAAREVF